MSDHAFLKRRWKLLLNVVTVLALLIFAFAIREQLADTMRNLARVNAWFLILVIPIQALNYHSQAKLYQGLFAVVGNKLDYRFLYRAALELNFINNVFPSAGVAGISYFGLRLRNDEITGGKATLVHVMKLLLLFIAFEMMLILGLLFLAIGNQTNDFVILVTSSFTTLTVVGTVVFAFIVGSQHRIRATFSFLTKLFNRVLGIFMPNSPETINVERVERAFEEIHNNYMLIVARWQSLKAPLFWAFMANLTELSSIYVIYLAFGELVNPGAVILAYGVANFAGLVSVMPGGVGIYEILMTGTLVAAGIPAAVSLPVTVMHRVVNTLVQVPPGYVLYHRALHRSAALREEMRENG